MPAARIEQAAEWWGDAASGILMHARGIEHQSKGVVNVSAAINLALACGRIGRPGSGVNMITGQGNGQGGREHGQKCDQLPGGRNLADPRTGPRWRPCGAATRTSCRAPATPPTRSWRRSSGARSRACSRSASTRSCSCPTRPAPGALDKLEHFAVIDFFLSETARHADVVLAGSLHEEDEGVVATGEGRVVKINNAVHPPGDARRDWRHPDRPRPPAGRRAVLPVHVHRADLRGAAAGVGRRGRRLPGHHVGAARGRERHLLARPREDHPGTPRLFEGHRFPTPSGRARFHALAYPGRATDQDYPMWFTTGRVVNQYLSGEQTRRIGPLLDQCPAPLCEMHPRLADYLGVADGDW